MESVPVPMEAPPRPPPTRVAPSTRRNAGIFRPDELFDTVQPDRRQRPATPRATTPSPVEEGAEEARSVFSLGGEPLEERQARHQGRKDLLARLFVWAAQLMEVGLTRIGVKDMAGYGATVDAEVKSGRFDFIIHRVGRRLARVSMPIALEVGFVLADSVASHVQAKARERLRGARHEEEVARATAYLWEEAKEEEEEPPTVPPVVDDASDADDSELPADDPPAPSTVSQSIAFRAPLHL